MKKTLSMIIVCIMIVSTLAVSVFAADYAVDIASCSDAVEFAAAGYTSKIFMFNYSDVKSIGEVDFSKYDSVVIEYSYDGDNMRTDVNKTPAQCFEDAAGKCIIGFTAGDKCFGYADVVNQDAVDSAIAYGEMVCNAGSWAGATRTMTLDISDVDYNGVTKMSVNNPWGTQVVISAVTFLEAGSTGNEGSPDTGDAFIVVVAATAMIALAGVVVSKKVRA